ncbi:uncharacterized protein LOC129609491 [Condylostylus longicornis]|uniref:uncharacterized protein LOC129609491 n=1 Tax=Condylostylus longicornis TaxID=2530218 RepID=UPI00244E2B71|nr:uncharacterized protein LOC129609491 [Condylostylus longicornis]
MKYLQIAFALFLSISLVTGQYFGSHYSNFGGHNSFGLHSLVPDYNSASSYSGSNYQAPIRDSRQDRGPVVFPPPPGDAPEESSGVIIGASGYGFVPPNSPQYRSRPVNTFSNQPSTLFDEDNEIRPAFDSFDSTRGTYGTRFNRYSSRYLRKPVPFF